MSEELDFETYLSISKREFKIYLLETNKLSCLYEKQFTIEENKGEKYLNNLSQFLEDNIFKIEKLVGKFINRIFIILDDDEITKISIGLKKKNYKNRIDQKILENVLIDAKDLFNENYQGIKIMHILINRFLVNGNSYTSFKDNIDSEHLCIEVQFIFISQILISKIDDVLKKYQIEIIKCIDKNYVANFFQNDSLSFLEKAYRIKDGLNQNEVMLIPKNPGKIGFFEKFFQLFS